MKTVQEIYTEYRIMPSLQLHQLRVAAVAKLVCDNVTGSLNREEILLACLFHDMGNIIKSDLKYFPEFVEPEGIEYWQRVKNEFQQKYGEDHHAANVAIAGEIGLSARSAKLIGSIGFSQLREVAADNSLDRKIVQYSDLRVGPYGILPLQERLDEGRERYNKTHTERTYYQADEEFQNLVRVAEDIEQQVLSQTSLTPSNITDAVVSSELDELRKYRVS